MPRAATRERTYVDDLTAALESLRTTTSALHNINLSRLKRPVAAQVKAARENADAALQAAIDAIRLDAQPPTRKSA